MAHDLLAQKVAYPNGVISYQGVALLKSHAIQGGVAGGRLGSGQVINNLPSLLFFSEQVDVAADGLTGCHLVAQWEQVTSRHRLGLDRRLSGEVAHGLIKEARQVRSYIDGGGPGVFAEVGQHANPGPGGTHQHI